MRDEPVVSGFVALDGLVAAVLAVLTAFGVLELSGEQLAAVLGVVVAFSAVAAKVVRGLVSPESRVNHVAEVMFNDGFQQGVSVGASGFPEDLLDGTDWVNWDAESS